MINSNENNMAGRIRTARDDLGLSRRELAELTDIPQKTIEKFETGNQEPSVSRLQTLCDTLNVTRSYLIDGTLASNDNADGGQVNVVEIEPSESHYKCPKCGARNDVPESDIDETVDMPVLSILAEIDLLRETRFEGSQRRAMELSKDVIKALGYLEPADLMAVAQQRGLYLGECPSTESLMDIFVSDIDEGQKNCGIVEERILDTAILGIDLYAIEKTHLDSLAYTLERENEELEAPGFFGGWGKYEEMVPIIRPFLRVAYFSGTPIEFLAVDDLERR